MHTLLVEVTSRENLAIVQAFASRYLETIYFPFSIRSHIEGSFPESPIRVFCYPSLNAPKYLFMVKDNIYIKPYCYLAQIPGTQMNRIEMIECLREFKMRAFGTSRPDHLICAKEIITKMYNIVMRMDSTQWESNELDLTLFFMTEKQQKAAMKEPLPKLPQGYYFDEIEPTEEGEMVNNTWKHAGPGDLEQTMAKLSRLPSSCVRFGGRPVAFEMVDPAGYFNNQFVFEDHRRKGLGNAVEIDLIHKAIKKGMKPYKTVTKDNKIVLEASVMNPLWTQWKGDDGRPGTIVFQSWTVAK